MMSIVCAHVPMFPFLQHRKNGHVDGGMSFWAKNTSCYSKLYRSSTMLATQFWGDDSPPVRERGRLGGGGTGGTFCDVRLAALSKFLEMNS